MKKQRLSGDRIRRAITIFIGIGLVVLLVSFLIYYLLFDPIIKTAPPPPMDGQFVDELIAKGFTSPTDVAIAQDGTMFVAERHGAVWIVRNGIRLSNPFVTLDAVDVSGERGLLGLAVHPAFPATPYVYLFYTLDRGSGKHDETAPVPTFGRLIRYTADGDVAAKHSDTILLGVGSEDGIPNCSSFHNGGALKMASDDSLYLSTGDGSSWEGVDIGDREDACGLLFGSDQDIGARRAQQLNSLAGKLLRIDPETGLGLPDNPFYDGDPHSLRSRIVGIGLRNPFRFTLRETASGHPLPYVSDVGWTDWEEITVLRTGANAGWPCFEGPVKLKAYVKHPAVSPLCEHVRHNEHVTFPLLTWHQKNPREGWLSGHPIASFTGYAVTGLEFYTGTQFPQRYWGALFFADYGEEWIKVLWVDNQHHLVRVEDFAGADSPFDLARIDTPVDIEIDPTNGDLVYVSISSGEVHRIRFLSH